MKIVHFPNNRLSIGLRQDKAGGPLIMSYAAQGKSDPWNRSYGRCKVEGRLSSKNPIVVSRSCKDFTAAFNAIAQEFRKRRWRRRNVDGLVEKVVNLLVSKGIIDTAPVKDDSLHDCCPGFKENPNSKRNRVRKPARPSCFGLTC